MTKSFEELANLDRTVHEPARLAILTALAECHAADFTFLKRAIGLTNGNLSAHLAMLEKSGLVRIQKRLRGKVTLTAISVTDRGRRAIERHWQQLEDLRDRARSLDAPTPFTTKARPVGGYE